MKKQLWIYLGILTISGLAISGCGTIIHGSRQEVAFRSDPPGAKVIIDSQARGTTPMSLNLSRKNHYVVEFELSGYASDYAILQRKTSGWVFLNYPSFIGFIIDGATGGMYRLEPDTLKAFLWPLTGDSIDRRSPIMEYYRYLEDQNSGNWNRPIFGTSLTYIWDPDPTNVGLPSGTKYLFQEYTWSLNLSYPIRKHWAAGIDNKLLFTKSTYTSPKNYWMGGFFIQYNLTPFTANRFFLQAGLYRGDYCTCGMAEPYRHGGLTYLGFAFGWNIRVNNNIFIDVGFENYDILNRLTGSRDKYNYTQYILGIDIHLPPKRSKPNPSVVETEDFKLPH